MGVWAVTWQTAFDPQTPGQGSLHLLLRQALFGAQSVFTAHSGRHPSYGFPRYSGKHVHDPAPFCSRQIALAPHGEGRHGLICSGGCDSITNDYLFIYSCKLKKEIMIK